MKKGSHKNQIIITTLALLLAVVGYISYDNRDTFMNAKDVLSTEIEAVNGKADTKESKECEDTQVSDEVALETDSTEEILNAGETVLTSASTESEECVAQVKLGREQVRSKNKEALQKIIDDAGVSEAEKKSAVDAMVKLTENAQMEEDAQMMLEAKGFKNAVVSLSDECCDVIAATSANIAGTRPKGASLLAAEPEAAPPPHADNTTSPQNIADKVITVNFFILLNYLNE